MKGHYTYDRRVWQKRAWDDKHYDKLSRESSRCWTTSWEELIGKKKKLKAKWRQSWG